MFPWSFVLESRYNAFEQQSGDSMDVLEVLKYLGGAAAFGHAPRNALELEAQLRGGMTAESMLAFKRWARLSNDELSAIADVSPKTLQRYFKPAPGRKKPAKSVRVAVSVSDRIFRAAEIIALALEVFGMDAEAAHEWLRSEQFGLGGKVPLTMLTTGVGSQLVEDELKRIQHGFLA
jgi:putative toxin-antitoxin system antitoxin component (TIGR02293 family)